MEDDRDRAVKVALGAPRRWETAGWTICEDHEGKTYSRCQG